MANARGRRTRVHSMVLRGAARSRPESTHGTKTMTAMTRATTPSATTSGRRQRTATAMTASTSEITPT